MYKYTPYSMYLCDPHKIAAFSPLKIRMGGTLQDKLIYQTNQQKPCTPFVSNSSQLLGFSQGCLSMARWDRLNSFFKETGYVLLLVSIPILVSNTSGIPLARKAS